MILNIITLGDYEESEELLKELKKVYEKEYLPLEKRNQEHIEYNKKLLNKLFTNKCSIVNKFKELNKIYENFHLIGIFETNNKLEVNKKNLESISKINKTVSIATPILAASTGIPIGLGTAAGVWAITSTFGIASTGTPIILLNGIAATNAILAAIGGGSLAVGGLGVAGGLSILGGIVVAPIAVATIYHTNKKVKKSIDEYKSQLKLINENIPKLLEINSSYEELNYQLEKITLELDKSLKSFQSQYETLNKKLYPIPFISKFFFKYFANKEKCYKKYSREINEILDVSRSLIDKFF